MRADAEGLPLPARSKDRTVQTQSTRRTRAITPITAVVAAASKPARKPAKAKAATPLEAAKVVPAPKPMAAKSSAKAATKLVAKPTKAASVKAAPVKAPGKRKAAAVAVPVVPAKTAPAVAEAPAPRLRRNAKALPPAPPVAPTLLVERDKASTVLGDFARSIRKEPLFYIYKHQFWFEDEMLVKADVLTWLRKRYTDSKAGHRYRLNCYKHKDGKQYVDNVLLETLSEDDMVELRLRGWLWTRTRVLRGNRLPRRKLTRDQRKKLDAIISQVQDQFYDNLQNQPG